MKTVDIRTLRYLVVILLALVAAALSGCRTTDPDQESDMPWNMPQQWESSPGIPGLETR